MEMMEEKHFHEPAKHMYQHFNDESSFNATDDLKGMIQVDNFSF